jgi:hypothetical protein
MPIEYSMTNTGWRRYLADNTTAAAYAITRGIQSAAPLESRLILNGGGDERGERFRGLEFVFFGAGANNDTFSAKIMVAQRMYGSGGGAEPFANAQNFGVAACTLGTTAGGGGLIPSTQLVVDTITWTISTTASTPRGPGDEIETAYASGFSRAYSPANEEEAHLILPELGSPDAVYVDFDMTGATSANCLYRWIR